MIEDCIYVQPTRNIFAMYKGLAGGKHQKTWKQEIRREHDSNPLQRHSHVHFLFFAGSFPMQFLGDFPGHPPSMYIAGGGCSIPYIPHVHAFGGQFVGRNYNYDRAFCIVV